MTVLNTEKVNHLTQPMFFGAEMGIARYDTMKYPIFDKSTEKQKGFFWNPEEINLTRDRIDFKNMGRANQRLFLLNLKYQSVMDSEQGRAPSLAFLMVTSLPELEIMIQTWSFFETIHSKAYTHIVRNAVEDPSKVFDEIMDDEAIRQRARAVIKDYDDFIELAQLWVLRRHHFGDGYGVITITAEVNGQPCTKTFDLTEKELKRRLYRALVSVFLLEGIRFYVSFVCSWAFAEDKIMIGNATELSLIARDEAQHLGFVTNILRKYRTSENDPVMLEVMHEEQEWVINALRTCVQEEFDWTEYLWLGDPTAPEGEREVQLMVTKQDVRNYLMFIANARCRTLQIPEQYPEMIGKDNPVPWTTKYLDTTKIQTASQETEKQSYLVGRVNSNLPEGYDWNQLMPNRGVGQPSGFVLN